MFKLVGFTAGVALYSFVASPACADSLKAACDPGKSCSSVAQPARGKPQLVPPPSLIPPPPDFPPRLPAPTGTPIKPGG
jgi:hypothetical protein